MVLLSTVEAFGAFEWAFSGLLECPWLLLERMMQDRVSLRKPLERLMQADLHGPLDQELHSALGAPLPEPSDKTHLPS